MIFFMFIMLHSHIHLLRYIKYRERQQIHTCVYEKILKICERCYLFQKLSDVFIIFTLNKIILHFSDQFRNFGCPTIFTELYYYVPQSCVILGQQIFSFHIQKLFSYISHFLGQLLSLFPFMKDKPNSYWIRGRQCGS